MPENNLVGRIIDGRFPLLEAIQSSEAGDVYRTQLAGTQPQRAALLLVPASEDQASAWKLAGSFSHPNLQSIFAGGRAEVDGRKLLYLVTELPEESLSQILPERPLTADETAEMLPPILDALAALHARGAVHAAVRPANVLVIGDTVKLSIASVRAAGTSPAASRDPHDAPEVGKGTLTPPADVWSLGATLVEALTQNTPENEAAVPKGIPAPFDAIARRCMQADPAKRGTIDEIRGLLNPSAQSARPAARAAVPAPVVAADPRPAARPVPRAEPIVLPARPAPAFQEPPQPARNRTPLYIAGGVIALVLLLILIFHGHKSAPSSGPVSAPVASSSPSFEPLPATPVGNSRGAVTNRVMPDIPERANRSIRGTIKVDIRVDVNGEGSVTSASIDSRSHSRYFADRALAAARGWRFTPPQSNGKPVPSTWSLRFQFRRDQQATVEPVQIKP